jgi:hypothetical protein
MPSTGDQMNPQRIARVTGVLTEWITKNGDQRKGEQNEDNCAETHPLGRFISYGGRDILRGCWDVPST